jgi:predicted nicotinamide N-methyase
MTVSNPTTFILANTTLLPVPLTPEIHLHLAHEAVPLWQKTEEELGEIGLPPPFWAFAWAGGQALARYVLDHPETVANKHVIDLASGSGLVAIAAMMAGAENILAADIDHFAAAAIELNVLANGFPLFRHSREGGNPAKPQTLKRGTRLRGHDEWKVTQVNLLNEPPPTIDTILVGDLFYEKSTAERVFAWLTQAKSNGTRILIGDPGRSYLPKDKLTKLAEYNVPVTRDLEDAEIKRTAVWALA